MGRHPWARPWSRKEIALLGTASDAQLGEMLGRGESDVQAARARRRIPAFGTGAPAPPLPDLSATAARLWAIYIAAQGWPSGDQQLALGWLAARGWRPTAAEIMARVDTVTRATAYRHANAVGRIREQVAEITQS
jgi:hypothetical protein